MKISCSVIIPAFNAAETLERCLGSISRQTYRDFEIIVVDDGSTDRTAEIATRWPDRRLRLIRQENKGVSAARNRGIESARGTWVAFLDADDEWMPNFLERTLRSAAAYPGCAAVFGNTLDAGSGKPRIHKAFEAPALLPDYFDFALRAGDGILSSCVLVNRAHLNRTGLFPVGVTHGEDSDLWARIAWTGDIVYVPEVLAVYHTEAPGSATKIPVERRTRYPHVVTTFRAWHAEGRIPGHLVDSSRRYAQLVLYFYIGNLLLIGQRRRARRVLLEECRPGFLPLRYLRYLASSFMPSKLYMRLRRRYETLRR